MLCDFYPSKNKNNWKNNTSVCSNKIETRLKWSLHGNSLCGDINSGAFPSVASASTEYSKVIREKSTFNESQRIFSSPEEN